MSHKDTKNTKRRSMFFTVLFVPLWENTDYSIRTSKYPLNEGQKKRKTRDCFLFTATSNAQYNL